MQSISVAAFPRKGKLVLQLGAQCRHGIHRSQDVDFRLA